MKFLDKKRIKRTVQNSWLNPKKIINLVTGASILYLTTTTPMYAKPIENVKTIRKKVDAAFFDQVRIRFASNNKFLLRAGYGIDLRKDYEIDFLGSYNGKDVTGSIGILGERIGAEANFTPASKTITLEGTVAGFLGQGALSINSQGKSLTARVARAEDIGKAIIQIGISGTRNPEGKYNLALDGFGLISKKIEKATLVSYIVTSLDKNLKGYGTAWIVFIPENSKMSFGVGASSTNLLQLKKYIINAEVRISK